MPLQAQKDRDVVLAGGAPKAEDFKLYAAVYSYKSDDPDDLQFEAGEILRVTDDEGDWFEGESQDGLRRGTFPRTFVRKLGGAPPAGGKLAFDNTTD